MVKIHPQHIHNPPLPPPPPPPPRRQTVRTPKQCCCFVFQLSFCLYLILCFAIIILVVVIATMFGVRGEVDVRVTDASLAEFYVAAATVNNTALVSYDLALNVTLQNPNRRIGVYYDKVKAFAFYGDELLEVMNLPPFYQGHKSTNTLRAVFTGNKTVSVGPDFELFSQFEEEKRSGVFSVVAAIAVTVRTKYGKIKYRHSPTYIDCYLRVPLRGKSSYAFETTRCGVVHIISYRNN